MTTESLPCLHSDHSNNPHHHGPRDQEYRHRHPGCPWDCNAAAYSKTSVPALSNDGEGAWVAHQTDYSGIAIFNTEVEALHYAVENSCAAKFVKWGENIR